MLPAMSDATDLKDRFALVRLRTKKSVQLDELVKGQKWNAAQILGIELGLPVSRGVVIDLHTRRSRH